MDELVAVYASTDLTTEEKLRDRAALFADSQRRFRTDVQPIFEAQTFNSFLSTPLNNATLLSRMVYYHRLYDFDALLQAHQGNLRGAVAALKASAQDVSDPYTLLPQAPR